MDILLILLQVIILDGILSIDNAAALAAIASTLSKKQPAPLPSWLRWLGNNQPQAALKAGILGAYLGRGLMLLIIGIIISFPVLKLVGAAYLLWLVAKYFWEKFLPDINLEEESPTRNASSFWKTVVMIEMADLAFSLDNVVAVVALSSHLWIIILGVCLSIFIMRFAAGIFIKLIEWEPLLEPSAYVLILAIAIELILKYFGVDITSLTQFAISLLIVAGFIGVGQFNKKYRRGVY